MQFGLSGLDVGHEAARPLLPLVHSSHSVSLYWTFRIGMWVKPRPGPCGRVCVPRAGTCRGTGRSDRRPVATLGSWGSLPGAGGAGSGALVGGG